MKITAELNYLRIAPRKVRLVVDLIRGKKVREAEAILKFSPQRSALPLRKLLNSVVANAKNNFQLQDENFNISEITVDEGPKLKRSRARSKGRAMQIQKKTSHITIVLESKEERSKAARPRLPVRQTGKRIKYDAHRTS